MIGTIAKRNGLDLEYPGEDVLVGVIPIGHDDSDRTIAPLVNDFLIVANIAVFVLLQGMGGNDRFTHVGGFVAGLVLVKVFAAGRVSR
jgi:membrane associated rhomboid family serine protease